MFQIELETGDFLLLVSGLQFASNYRNEKKKEY